MSGRVLTDKVLVTSIPLHSTLANTRTWAPELQTLLLADP